MGVRRNINIGDKFGYLTVIREIEPHVTPCGTIRRRFLCECECGNKVTRNLGTLTSNGNPSCGCKSFDIGLLNKKYTKEQTSSFLYSTWLGMRQRCFDKNQSHYKYYGGKGVTMCEEWMNDYSEFYKWSMNNDASKELTIDRIDNNGNYEPNNCRWVDSITQANNKTQNRIIEYNGKKLTVMQWSRYTGIGEGTIRKRLDDYGYTIAEALGFESHNKRQYDRNNRRKKVEQYSLDGDFIKLWDSAQDASNKLGISINSIRRCAAGIHKNSNGFIWKYKQ